MELQQARELSQEVVELLAPHCKQIEVVGSIRRKRPFPRDIDIVLIPGNQGRLLVALRALGPQISAGERIMRRLYKGVGVDLYFATPKTWYTLLLIRTGSKEHNIKLTSLAKRKSWILKANGEGLLNAEGEWIAGDSEESFFGALGLSYLEPEARG